MIQLLDSHKINQQYRSEIYNAINKVIDSGWYVLGEENENINITSHILSPPKIT